MIRLLSTLILAILISGCAASYPNVNPESQYFPSVMGNTLSKEEVMIPDAFLGQKALLLVGYRQQSQFDIDRWLIGLDMTRTNINTYEIPAIQGFIPRLFSNKIDDGMRRGIPEELWRIVITVYEDGEVIQKFTGNEKPNNARVILLNESGQVIFFYDRGFSVSALNNLREKLDM